MVAASRKAADPRANRLLGLLSPRDYQRLRPHLQRIPLEYRQSLYRAHKPIGFVYFIETGGNPTGVGLKPIKKGERRGGRKSGTPNQTTQLLKEALLNAARDAYHIPCPLPAHHAFQWPKRPCALNRTAAPIGNRPHHKGRGARAKVQPPFGQPKRVRPISPGTLTALRRGRALGRRKAAPTY